jgi:hypothetical protein
MKRSSLVFSIIFGLAAAVFGAGAGIARAAVILLDVSGTISGDENLCQDPMECSLGGDIVIGNSTNVVLGANVTLSDPGEGNLFTPFDESLGISAESGGLTRIALIEPPPDGAILSLIFATPTAGSVVGYTGGPLSPRTSVQSGVDFFLTLSSGSLTQANAAPIPEPSSSLLLLVAAIAVVSPSARRSWISWTALESLSSLASDKITELVVEPISARCRRIGCDGGRRGLSRALHAAIADGAFGRAGGEHAA